MSAPAVDFAALNRDFMYAWGDLETRLTKAVGSLGDLATNARTPEEQERLSAKADGVQDGLNLWNALSHERGFGMDFAGRWRTFADEMVGVLRNLDGKPDGYYDGVGLAVSYQRGYGDHVDAPRVENPRSK